ncbi:hypothetical protein T484DRAFT_1874457 [Baffinella frigidus]|nr:hypothetical protein T484DRAFT_1874457 [Cryptophyta sp. CCMP2293]
MADLDHDAFVETRDALVCDIVQELGEVVGNMSTLNRNLESLVEVGRDIERVSDVWLSFHGKVSTR